jgi:3-hydroxyisobutyrate dehydrogenase-like beta-hydroxyacid dehydrogenase
VVARPAMSEGHSCHHRRFLVLSRGGSFFVEHFIKDLGIAVKEATAMGLTLPGGLHRVASAPFPALVEACHHV